MYFKLFENVFFCQGAVQGLLIDTNKRQLYHVDSESSRFIGLIASGRSIENAMIECENNQDAITLVDYLENNDLGEYSSISLKSGCLPSINRDCVTPLDTVWIELTNRCNLTCIHCYNSNNQSHNAELLAAQEWESVLLQISELSPQSIIFIGGEPTVYKDLITVLNYARSVLPISNLVLYTNLTSISEQLRKCVISNRIKIISSLYSYDFKVHDRITGVKGSWCSTIENAKTLINTGTPVRFNTVVMKDNEETVEQTITFINHLTGKYPKTDSIRCVTTELLRLAPSDIKYSHDIFPSRFKAPSKAQLQRNINGNSCWQGKINITCDVIKSGRFAAFSP